MICAYPVHLNTAFESLEVPCGRCMCCRINRRRQWKARLEMESRCYPVSAFVTLTYDDITVPWELIEEVPQMVLVKWHFQDFMKRYRYHVGERTRYFAVGEYGDRSGRPHYHAILFGQDPQMLGDALDRAWKKGFTTCREAEGNAYSYIAGYATKKWTNPNEDALQGRPPEFSLQSRSPAIGEPYIQKYVCPRFQTREGCQIVSHGLLTRAIRIDGLVYPLDRTMTTKLLEGLGLPLSYEFGTTTSGIKPTDEEREQAKGRERKAREFARSKAARATI